MTRHYAVEISLTRPVSSAELHRASRRVPLAANADRTRLMTVRNEGVDGQSIPHPERHEMGQGEADAAPVEDLATVTVRRDPQDARGSWAAR